MAVVIKLAIKHYPDDVNEYNIMVDISEWVSMVS